MAEMLESYLSCPELERGQIVSGTVVRIGPNDIVVDIGAKTEGFLSTRNGDKPEALAELEALVNGQQPGESNHTSPSVLGTIAEFNVVRDAQNAYHLTPGVDATLLRRNHAYFWYPVKAEPYTPIGFLIDAPQPVTIVEQNSIEGTQGTGDRTVIPEQRGPKESDP